MTTTVTGKLTKDANEFQAGESIGFGLRLGKQYYDRETKQKEWTNYEAVIFAKAPAQIEFYRSVLVEGSVIEVTAEAEKIRKFEGTNGLMLSIELIDAKLGYTFTSQSQGQQQSAPQQSPQQAPQQAPQSPLGYYFADGTAMSPQECQYYMNKKTPKWAKGTQPPA